MKKISLTFTFFAAFLSHTTACDVCGCALGAMSLGVLPENDKHFIGLRYSYASFGAQIDYNSFYLEDVYSDDSYNRAEVFGRYYFIDRLAITAIVPYVINQMNGNLQSVSIDGVGDPTVMAAYKFLKNKEKSVWKQNLIASAGLTFPLGENEFRDGEELVNRNFQPGKGSFSVLLNLNYLIKKNNWGANIETSYAFNTTNPSHYRFGNQLNASLNLFYLLSKEKIALMPMIGGYFEQANQHTDGKFLVTNSGGNAFFGMAGFQLYLGKYILNTNFLLPIHQDYKTDNLTTITANNRITLGIRYSF